VSGHLWLMARAAGNAIGRQWETEAKVDAGT